MECPIIHVICPFGWLMEMNSLIWIRIWIIHSMTCVVLLRVVSGDGFLVTQSTDIQIVPSMIFHVSLFIVLGNESQRTLV